MLIIQSKSSVDNTDNKYTQVAIKINRERFKRGTFNNKIINNDVKVEKIVKLNFSNQYVCCNVNFLTL